MAPFQLPYPTSAHFDAARGMPPAPSLARRKALAALVANAVRHDANGSSSSVDGTNAPWAIGRGPLRALLHAECARAGSSQCLARGGKRGGSFIWNTNNETFAAYQSAVFCLQPWGDSATRKGFWDALLAGCINVIFDDAGWNETDAWFGDHRHWTVRVPLAELGNERGGALGYLRALPRARVERLHAAVRAVRGRIQYAIDGGTPGGDGVDVIVRRVAEHFERRKEHSSQQARRRGAGESNACKAVIGHVCKQVKWLPQRKMRPA